MTVPLGLSMVSMRHRPVMLQEVLASISVLDRPKLIIDATFGCGGHSQAILGKVIKIV